MSRVLWSDSCWPFTTDSSPGSTQPPEEGGMRFWGSLTPRPGVSEWTAGPLLPAAPG